jgi:hypothetical protein
MPGVTWWKLTNSIMVRRAGRKPTFARPAASVSLGSERTLNSCAILPAKKMPESSMNCSGFVGDHQLK